MLRLITILITGLLLCSTAAMSQEQSGELIGTVRLEDGSAVSDVSVLLEGTNLIGNRKYITDEKGQYRFPLLPPGNYTVTLTLEGFKQVVRKGIVLEVGRILKLDVVMPAGAVRDEIVLYGASPIIDVRKNAITSNITKAAISKLPKRRDFTGVVATQAGINYEGTENAGGFSFNGASLSENTFFVDGMNTTDTENGFSGQRVDYDSVEEVQMKSSGSAAEYGGSMGGVISVITRSGGNRFHGSLSIYYENRKLRGNPREILMLDPVKNYEAYYIKPYKDRGYSFEPGISLGGYIIKDSLWFFTSIIPQFEKINRPGRFIENPEYDRAIFTFKRRIFKGTGKLTAVISNNLRLSLSGTFNHVKKEGALPLQSGSTAYVTALNMKYQGRKIPIDTFSGNLDYLINSNLFLNISGGSYRTNEYDSNGPVPITRLRFNNSNSHIPGVIHHAGNWHNSSWDQLNADIRAVSRRISLKGDLTYYFSFKGEHVVKTGLSWSNVSLDKFRGVAKEYWYFHWKNGDRFDTYVKSDGTEVPLDYGYVRSYAYGENGKLDTDRWAFYIQDSWTIADKLTINYGLRFENEDMPSMDKDQPDAAFRFGFFDKIAPRIGFVYDFNGDGNNKLFGSFGLYYDVMKLSMATSAFGGVKYVMSYYNIADPDWTKYEDAESQFWSGSEGPVVGGELLETVNMRTPSFSLVQPDMEPFSKVEVSLGYQKKLGNSLMLTVRGLYNSIINAVEDVGIRMNGTSRYFIGNPGSAWINKKYREAAVKGHIPYGRKCPSPKRRYYSLQVNFDKKFSNRWLGGFSLTFSRLWGNFSGLASTDEAGRQDPNVQKYFDSWFIHYDSKLDESTGLLPTDRPFQAKIYGAYSFDSGFTIGFNMIAGSGTPISRSIEINGQDGYYPDGRKSDGRTPFYWQADLYIEYSVKLTDKVNLNLNMNITNITDNKIARSKYNLMTEELVNLTNEELMKGFDSEKLLETRGYVKDPRFLMKNSFQPPLQVMFGVRLSF